MEKTLKLKAVCDSHNVPLRAAALQIVLAHPAIISVIPGTKSPEHQVDNYKMVKHPIPRELWKELKEKNLLDEKAPVPP